MIRSRCAVHDCNDDSRFIAVDSSSMVGCGMVGADADDDASAGAPVAGSIAPAGVGTAGASSRCLFAVPEASSSSAGEASAAVVAVGVTPFVPGAAEAVLSLPTATPVA